MKRIHRQPRGRSVLHAAALAGALASSLVVAPEALAGRVIGSQTEEDEEAAPKEQPKPSEGDAKKAADKKDDGKKDDGKKDDGKKKADKKAEPEKAKGSAPKDVLDDSDEEKKKKAAEAEKRRAAEEAAEKAAEEEARKLEEAERKKAEEKRAADEKRRKETRDQRLAAAKKLRQLTRTSGDYGVGLTFEPGMPTAARVLEIRLALTKKLDVADPRFGNLMPLKDLDLVAVVEDTTGKKNGFKRRFAVHPLDAPGKYGFHVTLPQDGQFKITLEGKVEGRPLAVDFPVHVGAWPPPDFDDEEKRNLEASDEAGRGGRSIITN